MYRQVAKFYFIISCYAAAVRVESNTNNLQTIVQPTIFNSV